EIEVKERKDRVDDALNATKAAVEEGIIPGGGTALLYASRMLANLTGDNEDQTQGIAIVRRAIQYPIRIIVQNAGQEASIIVGKLLEQKSANYGYDAQNEKYVDFIDAGIVDPTKVVRVALQNAASVAGLLITTEAMIADRPEKKSSPMPGGGGMGGMGDMDF
ncbi:MAG: TCP-1/cpn60 chaperonin family protein, partial [Rhizomicrobium sp.]